MGPTSAALRFLSRLGALTLCWFLLFPALTEAHPMGNFSINHYSGIQVGQAFIELRYLLDMAEIPTFQEMQANDLVPRADDSRVRAYLAAKAESFQKNLLFTVNGRPFTLQITSQEIVFAPGAGHLPTMKIGLVLRANLQEMQLNDVNELRYRDSNFPGHAGWKEVVTASGAQIDLLNSSAPPQDRSAQLTKYPT